MITTDHRRLHPQLRTPLQSLRLNNDLLPRPLRTGTLLPAQRNTPQHYDGELPREREWTCDLWLGGSTQYHDDRVGKGGPVVGQ